MRDDLLDAQAAVDWAVAQLPMLQTRIAAWAGSYSTRIAVEKGRKAYYVTANPVPAIINAETGSIINSIRTSLDLLASALAGRNGHSGSRSVSFPVCRTEAEFLKPKTGGKTKIRLLSPADQAIIESLQPYRVGGALLLALHELDIMRKHQRLVTVQHFVRGVGVNPLDGTIGRATINRDWRDFGGTIPIAWTDINVSDCSVQLGGVYVAINKPGAVQGRQVVVALPKFVSLATAILARFDK